MAVKFSIEKFEGPLDLLLQLVEREELPITEVSLAAVTDQYLEYLEHGPDIPKEELADFLVVAARLLLIKSKALLPSMETLIEEEGLSLEQQLRMYREFANAAKNLDALVRLKRFTFPREKPPVQSGMFAPPKLLKVDRLAQVFREVIQAVEPVLSLPKAAVARAVSIKEKINELRNTLAKRGKMSFNRWVRNAKSKTEVIVSFLAMLELVKQRRVSLDQEDLFEEIIVKQAEKVPQKVM